jgi:hypothetical protein
LSACDADKSDGVGNGGYWLVVGRTRLWLVATSEDGEPEERENDGTDDADGDERRPR